MEFEKFLCFATVLAAALVVLVFLVDLGLKMPFGRASAVLDILFVLGGAFVLWQGLETLRELR